MRVLLARLLMREAQGLISITFALQGFTVKLLRLTNDLAQCGDLHWAIRVNKFNRVLNRLDRRLISTAKAMNDRAGQLLT